MMTVKIDRYEIQGGMYHSRSGKGKIIFDYLTNATICFFDTDSEETNQVLAELILKELNSGKYEDGDVE